jgi:hypothetical protein
MVRRGKAARFSGVSEGLCRPTRDSRRSCDTLEALGIRELTGFGWGPNITAEQGRALS